MNTFLYRVNSGDTLSEIARRYNVPGEVLARLNGISDLNWLRAGQMLKIPNERGPLPQSPRQLVTDRVRAGESLPDAAWRHSVSLEALAQVNGLKAHSSVAIGQVLKIPNEHKPTQQPQSNRLKAASTKTAGTVASSTERKAVVASAPKTLKSGMFERGKEIASFGRVRNDDGVNFCDAPGGTLLKRLPFNTRVFVSRELPGDWYFVTLDDGSYGYVARQYVSINPPGNGAVLHKIKKGESALAIVKQYYKGSAISWGEDERYYVNVLVEANRGKELSGIYKPTGSADWSKTQTRENYLIWIPTLEFAKSLRGKVSSGSLSYEAWQAARRAAEATGDFLLGSVAFQAGVIHGALESVWDLVTGLFDLAKLLWDIFKSAITGNILSDVKGLWELVKSLQPSALIDAGLKAFLRRWNDPSFLRRWHFRGWVVGYAVAEILMAVVSGSATLVKWAGKAGKFSKLIAKFPKVLKAAERVTDLSKRVSADSLKQLKKVLSRTPDEDPTKKRKYVPFSGRKYVGHVDPKLEAQYHRVCETVHDAAFFLKLYRNTGISKRVLERVHKHVFHTVHEVAVGANKVEKGYFAPDDLIAELWTKAMDGKLSTGDTERFRRVMSHEYVESKLMEQGIPYKSAHPKAWNAEGTSIVNIEHHGAHELAPHATSKFPLKHWEFVLGVNPPPFELAKDLSNLDNLVQDILKLKRGWKR